MRSFATTVAAMALGACSGSGTGSGTPPDDSDEGGSACTAEARPGIEVKVRDAVTDASIGEYAIGSVIDGAYTETLEGTGSGTETDDNPYLLSGVYERAGTYDVTISLEGYQSWGIDGVVVQKTAGACHVATVTLTAQLEPIGG